MLIKDIEADEVGSTIVRVNEANADEAVSYIGNRFAKRQLGLMVWGD
jgi:hypothetical protein